MDTFLDRLEQQIASRHLLTHPFYLAWTRGELRRDTLAAYAQQYYQHVAAFPTYLSAAHAGCDDQFVRRQLLANLIDEEAGEPNHPALWRQFAESLGVTPNELEKVEIWPETAALIATFRRICRSRNTGAALAALYAYESQIPAISESKIDGLRKHYGFTDENAYRYFTVHIEADREHAAVERALLAQEVRPANAKAASEAARQVLDALWELLSGVCRRHALAC
ncbi:MAG: CADD family putative folate metabolism protein [Chthoniobacterales bacterium]